MGDVIAILYAGWSNLLEGKNDKEGRITGGMTSHRLRFNA